MVKHMITEISESDFRKLDLHAKEYKIVDRTDRTKSPEWVDVSLNSILTAQLEAMLESGYESDSEDLDKPLTIAIHVDNDRDDITNSNAPFLFGYFDKFMNRFSGPATYALAFGIPHLYSTRDYYESHTDYWRVKKKETKVIYRITIDQSWRDRFVLKHKKEIVSEDEGDYNTDGFVAVERKVKYSDLGEDGEWVTKAYAIEKYNGHCTSIIPTDENFNPLR